RFCMASAVRDLFAVGVPRMAVGMLIAVVLFSLTAAVVQVLGFSTFAPHPMGWHVLVGGLIFGFGMVFTGGCASGSLYKAGEGNVGSLKWNSLSYKQTRQASVNGNYLLPIGSPWRTDLASRSFFRYAADDAPNIATRNITNPYATHADLI